MAITTTDSKRFASKKAARMTKAATAETGTKKRVVLRLPKTGKLKRSDIRKAVLAVRDRNAKLQTSSGE